MIETRPRPSVASTLDEIDALTRQLVSLANRQAEYASLAGESSAEEYRRARARLGRIAMRACRDLKALSRHEHDWNSDDYCNVCGADGRA